MLCYFLPMTGFEPWHEFPSFTEERLSTVAGILRDVRHGAVTLHQPEQGDTAWSLGCRIYSRRCFSLTLASQKYSWLRILPDLSRPLRFVFAIGSIPVRVYRGLPDDPPDRYLDISDVEESQMQLALQLEEIPSLHRLFRLSEDINNKTLETSKVVLVELTKKGTAMRWYDVPLRETSNVAIIQAPPVNLPQPVVEPVKEAEKKEKLEAHEAKERNAK
jgi:hypothetical protein